jgi:NAD(P)-dependent dehydrogenase (short-subunit alcohol dehydrogenase family)
MRTTRWRRPASPPSADARDQRHNAAPRDERAGVGEASRRRQVELSGKVTLVTGSSRGAFRGEPETPAYGARKAGLNAMSQSLAQVLVPHGVFFYVGTSGFVETDMADAAPRERVFARRAPWGASPPRRRSRVLLLDVAGATIVVSIGQASGLTGPEHHWVLCKRRSRPQ